MGRSLRRFPPIPFGLVSGLAFVACGLTTAGEDGAAPAPDAGVGATTSASTTSATGGTDAGESVGGSHAGGTGGIAASSGVGGYPCAPGEIYCASFCVSTVNNDSACGGCGVKCDNGSTCQVDKCAGCGVEGTCAPGLSCQNGTCECKLELCGYDCVDTQSDARHCGACFNDCAAAKCLAGRCICPDYSTCQDGCFDLTSDPEHCGDCNHACAGMKPCLGGECK